MKIEQMNRIRCVLPILKHIDEYSNDISSYYNQVKKIKLPWKRIIAIIVWIIMMIDTRKYNDTNYVHLSIVLFFLIAIVVNPLVLYKRKKNALYQKIRHLEREKENYINTHSEAIVQALPDNYRYYLAACYILECLENGRAADMGSALNLFEQYRHQINMQKSQQNILNAMKEQQEQLDDIERRLY